ncbi:MAG: hypothetical protein PVH34_09995 [Syntrophobacterales bacterium]
MNCCRETTKMDVPHGNRRVLVRGVPERYVAGADIRGRQEGRPYPWSQQVIHKTSRLQVSSQDYLAVSKSPKRRIVHNDKSAS